MGVHKGQCLCGKVKLEIDDTVQPLFSLYCHCKDCTRWQGGAVVTEVMFPMSGKGPDAVSPVKVVEGAEALRTYSHAGQVQRQWCDACGSHLIGLSPHAGAVAVFPGTFRGSQLSYAPTMVRSTDDGGGEALRVPLLCLTSYPRARACVRCSTSTTRATCWSSLTPFTSGRTSPKSSEAQERWRTPHTQPRSCRRRPPRTPNVLLCALSRQVMNDKGDIVPQAAQ